MKIDRSRRRIGCEGNRKTIQRYRETLATGFQVSLLLGPAADEGFGVKLLRQSDQLVDLSCREEAPRDFRVIGVRPDVFDINADIGVSGDGDERETG